MGGVQRLALALALWLLITAIVIAPPLVRDYRRRASSEKSDRPTFRRFWRFNSPRAVNGALEIGLEWADVLIVAALASPAAAGVYAVATRAVRVGGLVDKAMRVSVSPTTSAQLARGERQEASALHTKVVRVMILLNWPFYLLLMSMGGSVLLIFGSEFAQGWGPMALIASAMMFQTAAGMLQSILLQGGRSTWQMYNKSLALALSIGGNLLLVPLLGVWGAAVTWVVVMVVDNLLAAYQVHWRMGVHLQPRRLLIPALVPVVVYGVGGGFFTWVGGTSILNLLLAAVVLSAIYALALWVLRRPLQIVGLWRKVPIVGPRA
ncbi:lipopolysaccharide biosynthesis protein [Microbacterium sp. NIBRBAC000506063]|uniref:lipopolysaccharide biosynthesis protein n=1 Tax=Microbacterium sp. NIBRBAC000506063 TaxID=2734618 RepID=UPI001BB6EC96|nr:polysaccharide biosynthesis C-terminal domain-containing protein [Microbacterium sp. NIBRBAC000506063]QTV80194.1 polysaccharide biosynthesis protein [Microbacterium sp. NIBRBAC000506063]